MAFSSIQPFPGIWHIQDCMGVCFTLIAGADKALLVDTGYGLENVAEYVRTLTNRPLRVILTHGHHDHMLGAQWFDSCHLNPVDLDDYAEYSADFTRRRVLSQTHAKGLTPDENAFLSAVLPQPLPQERETIHLGGLTAEIIPCPGHTKGSLIVWIPEYRLLLTGDDWNPCTWLFFHRAPGIQDYLKVTRPTLLGIPAEHVLCSHQHKVYPASDLHAFLNGLTEACIQRAEPRPGLAPSPEIDPRECSPTEGQILVFDWNKYIK